MNRPNIIALSIVVLILTAIPAALFGYQSLRTQAAGVRVIEVIAKEPGAGGFTPDRLELVAGETVTLRLSSPDVVHGLLIPGLGVDIAEIYPGKPVEVTLTPAAPGRYAFACTRWCGVDHWRMRGVIEVRDAGSGASDALPAPETPLYQQLGIDLDAMRHDAHELPARRPSAARGATLGIDVDAILGDAAARAALSPAAAFHHLRRDGATSGLSGDEVWDVVAWAWLKDAPPAAQARASELYARDCAACHGEGGKGDGVAGEALPGMSKMDPTMPAGPADFTDAAQMLAASDALLGGKILRGGMGTGMPEFGSLYTDDELDAMVDYLRRFLFDG